MTLSQLAAEVQETAYGAERDRYPLLDKVVMGFTGIGSTVVEAVILLSDLGSRIEATLVIRQGKPSFYFRAVGFLNRKHSSSGSDESADVRRGYHAAYRLVNGCDTLRASCSRRLGTTSRQPRGLQPRQIWVTVVLWSWNGSRCVCFDGESGVPQSGWRAKCSRQSNVTMFLSSSIRGLCRI